MRTSFVPIALAFLSGCGNLGDSDFVKTFDPVTMLTAMGESRFEEIFLNGTGGHRRRNYLFRDYRITVTMQPDQSGYLVRDFSNAVGEELMNLDFLITGTGHKGGPDTMSEFAIQYQDRQIDGHLYVYTVTDDRHELQIRIVLHEIRR